MSARARRPQMVPERGLRVVLLAPKHELDRETAAALADLDRIGWVVVSMVAPERFLDALRLVLGGLADRVVVTQPEHFPFLVMAGDLGAYASSGAVNTGRTRMLPRPGVAPARDVHSMDTAGSDPRERRPQPVQRPASEPGFGHSAAGSDPQIRHATTDLGAGIAQAPARSANLRSEFSTPVPDPVERRRASQRRVRAQDRRRRRA